MSRLAPSLLFAVLALPVLVGTAATLAPGAAPGMVADLLAWPGLPVAMRLSLVPGLVSTALALLICLGTVGALHGTRALSLVRRALSPLLSLPHAAAALGLAFLIAPSGWIARALSPEITGWQTPPDLLILNDPAGLSLTFGLLAKELPFLLLMALAALGQIDADRRLLQAASMGYGRLWACMLTVAPALYAQIRLPVFAVLGYAMTSVDMAMVLGPSLPPSLSVQITRWMTEADPSHHALASAAAGLQLALVLLALAAWLVAERVMALALPRLAALGARGRALDGLARPVFLGAALLLAATLALGLAALALWSLAGPWSFPDAFPEALTFATWQRAAADLIQTTGTTLALAGLSTLLALALVLARLQSEARTGRRPGPVAMVLLYLPLILPQTAFLPGLTVLALQAGLPGGLVVATLGHLIFVTPYCYLSLSGPWRAWDGRTALVAAALGSSSRRIFWRLRLPMLLTPLLTAAAVGLAVSIGLYLPTLLLGGGRVETLTTEALALAAGGNRRLTAATALLQMLLPALGFALALGMPRLIFRHRRALRTG